MLVSAVVAVFTALAILPAYTRFVSKTRWQEPPGDPQPSWAGHVAIAIVIAGSLLAIGRGIDYWPFSPYAMYSEPKRWEALTVIAAYGVVGETEIPLRDGKYLDPFDARRIWLGTYGALRRGHSADQIARFYFNLYDKRRMLHGGPALRALRLYRETSSPRRPTNAPVRDLLFEVSH